MYRTCGTQLNVDFSSEKDFVKKFKVVNSIVPISIALFSNSSIVEKKKWLFILSFKSLAKYFQRGLPTIFFDNFDFEKYADFIMNFKILFLEHNNNYVSEEKYSLKILWMVK